MANELLLLEDVEDLGRSGDLVKVKPGYARNYLLPQKKAVIADKRTLRMQAKLKEEREKQAVIDRNQAMELSARLEGAVFEIVVKVDPDGHMYGSVSSLDVAKLIQQQHSAIERKNVQLVHPIKELGVYPISLKLKEGVMTQVTIKVVSEATALEEKTTS